MINADEESRLAALYSYQMLDTDAEKHFDATAYLAAFICKTPMAIINLVDDRRTWAKSAFGYQGKETPIELSFCKLTISSEGVLEIPDTRQDDRVKDSPFVTCDNPVRFYAGAPLINPDGFVLGTICVFGNKPNKLDDYQKNALQMLAEQTVLHLETAKKNQKLQLLFKKQQEFQALFNNSCELHYILTTEGKIEYVNSFIEQILGYKAEEAAGKTIWDFCNAADRKTVLRKLKKAALRGEQVANIKTRMLTKSGESRWFSWTNAYLNGKWLINGRDITKHILDRQQLEQLSLVASHVNNGVVINDTDNHILWVNKAFENITGYTLEEVKGNRLRNIVTGKETNNQILDFANTQSGIKSFSVELLTYNKLQQPVWLSIMNSVVVDEKGEIGKSVEIITDITERKKTELELQTLSAVITKSEAGVLIRNGEEKVVWLNESLEKLLGWHLEELKDKALGVKFLVGKLTDFEEVVKAKKKLANNLSYDIELQVYKKDGTPIWVSIHSTPMLNTEGVLERQLSIFMDISVRKKAEMELIKTREDALRLSRAKETFISVMSHEIRTPINAVIGMTNALLEENPGKHQLGHLNILKFSSENLMALVNDILDFTKIETGNMKLESVPVDLQALANQTLQSVEYKLAEKQLKLLSVIDPKIPQFVLADSTRLYQIIINLLSNAIKFTAKGKVELTLTAEKEDQESITVNFAVLDTGIGIPPEKLTTIFEAYAQASTDTTRNYGGTGLGLTITKKLIELHQSNIRVKSVFGLGSEFSFSIKFIRADAVLQPEIAMPEKEISPALVLVVDDNAINCMLAKKVLSKWGIEADCAENGLEALKMITQKNYNLVLMDLHMPVMDGLIATRKIRSLPHERYQKLPIIALTGSVFGMDLLNLQEDGLTDYFLKPYIPDSLFQKIKPYLKNISKKETVKITC